MSSPQGEAAASQAAWQSMLSQRLANVSIPMLTQMLGQASNIASNPNQITPDVKRTFQSAYQQLDESIANQKFSQGEVAAQRARTSGYALSPLEVEAAQSQSAGFLDQAYRTGRNQLAFQEKQASLQDWNAAMSLMGQGIGSSLSLATGFGGAAGSAIGYMSNQNPWAGAAGGAMSGAAAGSTFGPYGTAAGAIIGGLGGYFGSGG